MDTELTKQLASEDPRDRAKVIKSMAISGDPQNLQALETIHETDPDPRVREYAAKAAAHLHHYLDGDQGDPSPAEKPKNGLETQKYADAAAARITQKPDPGAISRADRERAENLVQRAFNLHASGQTKKAVKIFKKALQLHPGLEGQTFSANLAMELTGLPFQDAFDSLLDRKKKDG